MVESEDYFRVQTDRPSVPTANSTNQTLVFDLLATPSGKLLVNGTLDNRASFFLLKFEEAGSVQAASAPDQPAPISTDAGITDELDDNFTTNHVVTDGNGRDVRVSLGALDRKPDAAVLGVSLAQKVVGSLGISIINSSFPKTLLQNRLIDAPFVSVCYFNQFTNLRSQIFFGDIPAFLTEAPRTILWTNSSESSWEFHGGNVSIKSGIARPLPVRLDLTRRGVTLDSQLYAFFLAALHQNGFVCRPEFDALRCFSRYLFRSARFPNIDIDFSSENSTQQLTFNGEFLLFNDDEQLQDGVYKLDISEGSADEIVFGNTFLNQFAVILDLQNRRVGLVDVANASPFLFRNFRSQLYLNRVVFVTLIAFVIAVFMTKVLRVSEEGTETFEFFSPQIMD